MNPWSAVAFLGLIVAILGYAMLLSGCLDRHEDDNPPSVMKQKKQVRKKQTKKRGKK